MAKLGFKAVKPYYRANKHRAGDSTIKDETNMHFKSSPCCIRYTFCMMLL